MQDRLQLPKNYLSYPKRNVGGKLARVIHGIKNLTLFPFYLGLAYFHKSPGLAFRVKCIGLSLSMLLKKHDLKMVYNVLVMPMDSVRYFEFDFMWKAISNIHLTRYLDVSSPRLLPIFALLRHPDLKADLINPDKKDLPITQALAQTLALTNRCQFHSTLISDVPFTPASFDVVSCVSVLEHIPNDSEAVAKMWSLVKPGGKLLISVPCASEASEEFINVNEYELIESDHDGFVFWQRYYDEALINQHIYSITGQPSHYEIFAEKQPGNYEKNVYQKRTNPDYPYWREPYMVSQEYEYKRSLSALPGMGVIAMEFIKPHSY